MASFENKDVRIVIKFNEENFNLLRFKLEMGLIFIGFWGIVDVSKEPSPSNVETNIRKNFKMFTSMAIFIVALNLVENQLTHIKSCKRPTEAWKTLCDIRKTRNLSNNLFIRYKFFTYKM